MCFGLSYPETCLTVPQIYCLKSHMSLQKIYTRYSFSDCFTDIEQEMLNMLKTTQNICF